MEFFTKVEVILLSLVIFCSTTAGQSATLQTSSNSEETFAGQTVTLTCDVENGFDVARHQIYWSKLDGSKETFLSADRNIYTTVEANLQRRLSITGDIAQGFFNLRIRETRNEDAGVYMCVLFDKKGIDKASLRLDLTVIPVRPPDQGYPKCEMSPRQPRLNDKVTFSCISKGSFPEVSLNWMRADDNLSQNSVAKKGVNGILTQHVISQIDNMVSFTCTASGTALPNPINCSVVPFSFPTTVNISPTLRKLKVGQDVTLACNAVAIPSPDRFKWTYGKGANLVKVTKNIGRLELLNNGRSLRIRNISKSDNNTPVRCIVRNSIDIKGSQEITLKVAIPTPPKKSPGSKAPVTVTPEINPRLPRPKPTTISDAGITRRKPNRPRYITPNIPMDERVIPEVTKVDENGPNKKAPTGIPPLFDKHHPTNNGRAGLLTGGLIGIACLLGAIFLVALMLIKLKKDEKSGNLVMTSNIEHSVTYTPKRYLNSENNTNFGNNRVSVNEDSGLSQGVRDRLKAERVLRDSIIASQEKDNKLVLENPIQKTSLKNDLARSKSSSVSEPSTNRRPNLVFNRFARPLTASSPPATKTALKTNSLPSDCNLNLQKKMSTSSKRKRTKNNVEGLLYADLDFTNVPTSQSIIPNSCETTYADITNFLKK